MANWLLKTEPHVYSFADLEREKQTIWDGVNNNLALKHIRTMLPGDLALIYHTGDERRAVGIGEVVSLPYADRQLNDPKRAVVDVKLGRSLPQPVTLAQIKQDSRFTGFDLIKNSRLSVVPVSDEHWLFILELAGEKIS
jgi:predicted RNA-binding protein with PUA-like domain